MSSEENTNVHSLHAHGVGDADINQVVRMHHDRYVSAINAIRGMIYRDRQPCLLTDYPERLEVKVPQWYRRTLLAFTVHMPNKYSTSLSHDHAHIHITDSMDPPVLNARSAASCLIREDNSIVDVSPEATPHEVLLALMDLRRVTDEIEALVAATAEKIVAMNNAYMEATSKASMDVASVLAEDKVKYATGPSKARKRPKEK